MNGRGLAYAALGFVAITTATFLGVIWRVGGKVERELADFGVALPAPTQLAFDARAALSIFAVGLLLIGALIHRHRQAVLFLVLVGATQIALGGAYGLALWLPYRAPYSVIE